VVLGRPHGYLGSVRAGENETVGDRRAHQFLAPRHGCGPGFDLAAAARPCLLRERSEAAERLRAISSRQEAILSAVPDIIMEVDNNKVYTWANQPGIEFFGEDVIGKEAAFYFEGEQDTNGALFEKS
jgi:PAS domain-containing protein